MKKVFLSIIIFTMLCFCTTAKSQSVAINTTGALPDSSAMLDVQSTDKGMLMPRMSSAQRAAIISPATGLLVFDTTTYSFWFKDATRWVELIDSSNTIWTNKYGNVYLNNGENVGIGTNNPVVRLQVDNGTAAANGGYMQLGSTSSFNLSLDRNEIQAHNNGAPSDLYMQVNGGNVGIGSGNATTKLQITNGTHVSNVTGGYLQLGASALSNLAFDNNEIQARNNSNTSTLFLQNGGSDVQIGGTASPASDLYLANGKLLKTNTGNYNMVPLCYGTINANGSVYKTTPNVTVVKAGTGQYLIKCAGINGSTALLASLTGALSGASTISLIEGLNGANTVKVLIHNIILNQVEDADFSFVFYTP